MGGLPVRWLFVGLWIVMALVLGGMLGMGEPVTADVVPTAYPPPGLTPTVTPVVVVGPQNFKVYLPLVSHVASGAPATPVVNVAPVREGGYRVTWAPVAGALSYRVFEAPNATMTGATLVSTVDATSPASVSFPARAPGVYYYRVVALNRLGASASPSLPVTVPEARLSIQEERGGGYAITWPPILGAVESHLYESTTGAMVGPTHAEVGLDAVNRALFGPRPRGTYYYRLLVVTTQVAAWSDVLAVPVPRPGLWGTVTYNGDPVEGILVQLRRCTVVVSGCVNWVMLDAATTQRDGSYSFTAVDAADSRTALYVFFDNARRDRNYLNFWRGTNVVGYDGRATVAASAFDIANIFLLDPAPGARLPNPVTFRWQPRANRADNYCVMFLDTSPNLNPLVPCVTLGYGGVAALDVEGVIAFDTPYNWTMWVENAGQGYGEGFFYRPITIMRGSLTRSDALRLGDLLSAGKLAAPLTTPDRESAPPEAQP